MAKKIQHKVADTILQRSLTLNLGGAEYDVESPTLGTLILVSERIAKIPIFDIDTNNVIESLLGNAKHCKAIGEVLAVFILGAKKLKDLDRVRLCHKHHKSAEDVVTELGEQFCNTCSLEEINIAFGKIIKSISVNDFFAITTFLQEVNLTKPTKVE